MLVLSGRRLWDVGDLGVVLLLTGSDLLAVLDPVLLCVSPTGSHENVPHCASRRGGAGA